MNKIEKQIEFLLNKMTLREKLGQTIMIEPVICLDYMNENGANYNGLLDPNYLHKLLVEYKVGFFLYGGVTRIGEDKLNDWAKHINGINSFLKEHNEIPLLYGVDAIHGVNFVKETSLFTHNLGAVSTFNPKLVNEYASIVTKELSSIGINCNFAPTIDVARDQRWGRVYESLGEDPFLASKMSSALVEGLQSNQVAACAKHYVGYGESYNGMDRLPASLSERSLKEIHLPPFEAAIKSGVKTIMINGGDVNGTPMPMNKRMMTDVLRNELNFKGITMSDWEDVERLETKHHTAKDKRDAIKKSFNAGLDMSMVVTDLKVIDIMEELVQSGEISVERVNQAVTNILRVKYELGLFEYPSIPLEDVENRIYKEEAKEMNRLLTKESLILLKNDNQVLPLSKDIKKILLLGKSANSMRHMCGGWSLNWASANEEDLDFNTIYQELKQYLPNTEIVHIEEIGQLKDLDVTSIDACISVISEEPHSEWLGDTTTMEIEHEDYQLLKEAKGLALPTVVLSMIGRPLDVRWIDEFVDSLLWIYYPGSEGALPVLETVFGDNNPSGKTPITFPKQSNQIPIYYNAKRYGEGMYEPLYPFGHGLSYTTFEYSNIHIPDRTNGDLEISLTVKNTGDKPGHETVLVYTRDVYASVTTPIQSLKGFDKLYLNVGEEKRISITITKDDLSLFDSSLQKVFEHREIEVIIKDYKQKITLK